METENRATPPQGRKLALDEDALTSRLEEIISGADAGATQNPEGPEDKDTFSMEEGDDSVFYSDEEQAVQDEKACDLGGDECRDVCLVNGNAVDAADPGDTGEDGVIYKETSEMEEEVTGQEEERQEVKTPESGPAHQLDPSDSDAEPHLTTEQLVSSCEEILTQPEQITSSGTGKRYMVCGLFNLFWFKKEQ